ncbi:MAG TPA: nicotinate (nicotinamide) nucleotide adenylyltransferase [Hanamia sp.]|nr:nicotinate (nicotinamide) nucleotide adenylyltransferase [Hanamia sp.]
MKIGLYFGSFNPIHNGHLIIASHIANYTALDRVWFVISPQNPLKQNASLINENHRKHLIDLAIEGEKKLRSSNIEFKLPRPSYTIDTLTHLNDRYPQHEFSIIMGSDSFGNIKKWKNYEVLLRDYEVIIYERPGFKVNSEMLTAKIKVLHSPLLQISSTHIRDMIHGKKSIRYLVPDVVKEEIERQQYYG